MQDPIQQLFQRGLTAGVGPSGAQSYALPTVQPEPVAPQQQPYDDGVRALEGLQYVKGQTEAYYKKVADLKSFMQGAHANLGVDVRVPDMSRPESIKLHQIYNDAITDILQTGNSLKQGNAIDMLNRNQNNLYAQGIDPTAQSAATLRPGTDVFSRNVEQPVVEINNKLQMPSQTAEEQAQKEQIYKEAIANYDKLIEENPDRKSYYEYQKKAITPPTKGDFRPFATPRDYRASAWGRKVQTSGNILKKTVNLLSGAHDSYQADNTDLTPEGVPYLKSSEGFGRKVGNSQVEYWRLNPITKKVDIKLQSGEFIPADSQDGLTLASNIGGADPDAVAEYAQKNDITDEYGQVDKSKLLGKDYNKLLEQHGKSAQKSLAIRQKTEDTIQGALEKLSTLGESSRTTLKLPKTKTSVVIERGWPSGKYYIKGFKESFLKPKDKRDVSANQQYSNEYNKFDYANGDGATIEEIKEFLFKKSLPELANAVPQQAASSNPGTEVAPSTPAATNSGKTVPLATIKSKVGSPGFEGYTEQELIDYYTSQGYTIK